MKNTTKILHLVDRYKALILDDLKVQLSKYKLIAKELSELDDQMTAIKINKSLND